MDFVIGSAAYNLVIVIGVSLYAVKGKIVLRF
jgi:hypothetical protein